MFTSCIVSLHLVYGNVQGNKEVAKNFNTESQSFFKARLTILRAQSGSHSVRSIRLKNIVYLSAGSARSARKLCDFCEYYWEIIEICEIMRESKAFEILYASKAICIDLTNYRTARTISAALRLCPRD